MLRKTLLISVGVIFLCACLLEAFNSNSFIIFENPYWGFVGRVFFYLPSLGVIAVFVLLFTSQRYKNLFFRGGILKKTLGVLSIIVGIPIAFLICWILAMVEIRMGIILFELVGVL